MKAIFRLLLAVVALNFCADTAMGEPVGNTTVKTSGKIIILHRKSSTRRPNAPSQIFIECHYDNGSILFIFPEGISSVSVVISNEYDEWYGNASVSEPKIVFPFKNGDYNIECISDDGRVFYGHLCFD